MTTTATARKPLLPRRLFLRHLLESAALGFGIVAVSLGAGMWGYHGFEGLSWLDAFLNASMILAGMGPVDTLRTVGGKVFAGIYAIYSGIALLTVVGVMLAPLMRRFLHRFHLENL